jgi:3-hydroxyisobutyrate dehydrogenase
MKGTMMVEEDFSANLARKDAGLVLDAAEARDLRIQIAESVVARFDEAIQAGHGEEGMAAVYRAARPDWS